MTDLQQYPPHEDWHDVTSLNAKAWPDKVEEHHSLVPDDLLQLRGRLRPARPRQPRDRRDRQDRGQPAAPRQPRPQLRQGSGHAQPGRRHRADPPPDAPGRASEARASGSASPGKRPSPTSAAGIATAMDEDRRDGVMYHVGRPGEDGYADRVLKSWGVDGHNSHTNICSSNARIGYQSWMGHDRPSSDFANAEVIFLISSHLEAGHYFNPHAQRIIEAQGKGATVDLRRPPPVQHRVQGRPLAARLARHRAVPPPHHREAADRERHVAEGLRAPLGQLGDLPHRDPARPARSSSSRSRRRCSTPTPSTPPRPRRRSAASPAISSARSPRSSAPTPRSSPPTTGGRPAPATSVAGRRPAACSSSTC